MEQIKINPSINFLKKMKLAELHVHLGSCVTPTVLWELAHAQGIKLPTKDYWEFENLVSLDKPTDYESYLRMFDLLERIQSSPEAMFTMIQAVAMTAYRENNIDLVEYRGNPILRSRKGEIDLDHLIVFTLQGMERAMLKYPIKVGFILCMDRRFSLAENEAIVKKAIKYQKRGIVGIDLAGPIDYNDYSRNFKPADLKNLVAQAKDAGLGVTIHTGEATGVDEMWAVVKELKPHRLGHGIAAINDPYLLDYLREHEIILETCPTSNLKTQVISSIDQMKNIYQKLKEFGVKFTINTDGPTLQKTNLKKEYQLLLKNMVLNEDDLIKANEIAHEATFLN